MDESPPQAPPLALVVVAVLFILTGLFALIEILVGLTNGDINLNFGVLGLFIGPGLLWYSRGWRVCALVFIWLALVGVPLVTTIMLVAPGPIDFNLFGQKVGNAPRWFALTMSALIFAVAFWEYRVLTRPDIKRLFGLPVG